MPNQIRKRLRLHQSWSNDIPLKNIWGINFSARGSGGAMSNVGTAIKHYLDIYRPKTFKVDTGLFDRVSDSESGFLLAQSVKMPQEEFEVTPTRIEQSGGFQSIQIGGDKRTNHSLDITFLETNRDVFSFFMQPWAIAASYKGLIEADLDNDLKCIIDIIQYTRTAIRYDDKVDESNKRQSNSEVLEYGIRKMHSFYNCVPNVVEGDSFSYGDLSLNDVTRTVNFNFDHYQLNVPNDVLIL